LQQQQWFKLTFFVVVFVLQGFNGQPGLTGSTGATGPMGSAGVVGLVGEIGPYGLIGSTGPIGSGGFIGSTGILGSTGGTGATGSVGQVGSIGVPGPPGVVIFENDTSYMNSTSAQMPIDLMYAATSMSTAGPLLAGSLYSIDLYSRYITYTVYI